MTAVAASEPTPTTAAPQPQGSQFDAKAALERSRIDAAASGPVLFFFTSAIAWLLVSTALGFITSFKLHNPEFLSECGWVTYGRILPAFNASFTYGWASMAGMGVGIWLMSRLCRVEIRYPGFLVFGAGFWNLGLTAGIIALLAGKNTGLEGMEISRGPAALMFVGYVFIGLWGAILYRFRRNAPAYISVWYLLGAFFWFPWFFGSAHVLAGIPQLQGVMQNVVAAWFSQGLVNLWFTAIGLAAAYYLIPKVINRPIYSYNLAAIGFWTFAFFGGLTGLIRLSGGPVPAWLVTISIAANIVMLVPIATVTANLVLTMRGNTHMVYYSPTIRFTYFGAIAFAIASFFGLIFSLRGLDKVVHFSGIQATQQHLLLYTFFSMVMFGAIYYITPRLVGCEWLSSTLIKLHFWGSAYGGGMVAVTMLFSALSMGLALVDPEAAVYSQIVGSGKVYLAGRSMGYFLVAIAHFIFALHFLLMLLRIGQPGGEPTLFATPGEEKH